MQVPLEQPPGDGGELPCLEMMFLERWMCLHELGGSEKRQKCL